MSPRLLAAFLTLGVPLVGARAGAQTPNPNGEIREARVVLAAAAAPVTITAQPSTPRAAQLAAGDRTTCLRATDGSVWYWG